MTHRTSDWLYRCGYVCDNRIVRCVFAYHGRLDPGSGRPPAIVGFDASNGYRIFNFAAAAAIHVVSQGKRVAILDWDVHYGQGIADIVQRNEVLESMIILYASIHQTPAFPYQRESDKHSKMPYNPNPTRYDVDLWIRTSAFGRT